MYKIVLDNKSGFDIAELTQNITSETLPAGTSDFSETSSNNGLLLISKKSNTNITHANVSPYKSKRTINRKHIIFDDTFFHDGQCYRVNTAKSGLYVEILTKIIEQFEVALLLWSRVFVLRFDLHTHIYTKDNKIITSFRKRLFQKLKRKYGFSKIGYCWVREQDKAKAQHYHFVIFLDGRLIRHSSLINELIKEAWEDPTGKFTMPYIPRPFHFVNSEEILKNAIYRVSYLAKPRGKGYRPSQTKDYQCSRIKLV